VQPLADGEDAVALAPRAGIGLGEHGAAHHRPDTGRQRPSAGARRASVRAGGRAARRGGLRADGVESRSSRPARPASP
jgi:hypothetical protein